MTLVGLILTLLIAPIGVAVVVSIAEHIDDPRNSNLTSISLHIAPTTDLAKKLGYRIAIVCAVVFFGPWIFWFLFL